MQFLKGVSALVVGLGESGVACAQFAHRCGAQVTVADTRETPPGLNAVQALVGVVIKLGALRPALLDGVDVVLMSPGLSPHAANNPDVAALLDAATQRGIAVRSEVDWFMQALADLQTDTGYSPKVLAVTGTNGKTTVTELTTHLCNESDVPAVACGNISPTMLTALMTAQDTYVWPAVWVLELSSFQLHYTHTFNPTAATVLNLSQDHLDWHASMDEYAADKAKIFGSHTVRVLNRDDAAVLAMQGKLSDLNASHLKSSHLKSPDTASITYTFGLGAPSAAGDVGCMQEGSLNWLCMAIVSEPDKKRRKADPIETHVQRLMPADALRLRGGHNHANALAALLLVQAAGVNIAKALHGLRSYNGAPNRCELVHIVNNVEYINDSKGTNVGATVAALNGLSEGRRRLVLIAGGVGKGQDFTPLRIPVTLACKAVVLIGESAAQIAVALADSAVPIHHATTMDNAVQCAAQLVGTGDAVLLSPACASFDMFKNYAHRAQVFIQAVEHLAVDVVDAVGEQAVPTLHGEAI